MGRKRWFFDKVNQITIEEFKNLQKDEKFKLWIFEVLPNIMQDILKEPMYICRDFAEQSR
jgi:hypothetical protein